MWGRLKVPNEGSRLTGRVRPEPDPISYLSHPFFLLSLSLHGCGLGFEENSPRCGVPDSGGGQRGCKRGGGACVKGQASGRTRGVCGCWRLRDDRGDSPSSCGWSECVEGYRLQLTGSPALSRAEGIDANDLWCRSVWRGRRNPKVQPWVSSSCDGGEAVTSRTMAMVGDEQND